MNTSILKHSFLTFGAVLAVAGCNKNKETTPSGTPTNLPAAVERVLDKPPAKENLLWFPVGEAKTLQTSGDVAGSHDKLKEVPKGENKTQFTNPKTNPSKTTLTNEYELTVNLEDIQKSSSTDAKSRSARSVTENVSVEVKKNTASSGEAASTGTEDKNSYLGVRIQVQEGVSYTVLRSAATETDDNKKKEISFNIVTEEADHAGHTHEHHTQVTSTNLTTNPEFVKYDAKQPKHTLVLFNGPNAGGTGTSDDTKLFKANDKVTLLLIAEKGNESQLVKLTLSFVQNKITEDKTKKSE